MCQVPVRVSGCVCVCVYISAFFFIRNADCQEV